MPPSPDLARHRLTRRGFLRGSLAAGGALTLGRFVTGCAPTNLRPLHTQLQSLRGPEIDLRIAPGNVVVGGRGSAATLINGSIPGPELRFREGDDVTIRVRNDLPVTSSIHWHGILLPPEMDGVPMVTYDGIESGTTFTYRYTLRQSGTYWYHSHSGFQEQTGVYGAFIVDPREPEPVPFDRDYTIVLSDWTFEDPEAVMSNLKKYDGYYNFQRRTLANLGEEAAEKGGYGAALSSRVDWARMRMMASDLMDVTGATYTYLCNGLAPDDNWTGLFKPGERVRLRFINASAASYFDVRIPGLPMTVISADGERVVPVETDEIRVATAETYDVIVQPTGQAHTIFAESMDRSGFARGTLAVAQGMKAPVPGRRKRPLLTMMDMGMNHGDMGGDGGKGHDMAGMKPAASKPAAGHDMAGMKPAASQPAAGHDMAGMKPAASQPASKPASMPMQHDMHAMGGMKPAASQPTSQPASMPMPHAMMPAAGCTPAVPVTYMHPDISHGAGNVSNAEMAMSRLDDPGMGLRDAKWRVLLYKHLRRLEPGPPPAPPTREIELHLTGNMERYIWAFDGEQWHMDMPTIKIKKGERVRFVLINDTMMSHPIHLHGMYFELEVGACERNPLKHTVDVKPAQRVSWSLTAEEVGKWAFHCHILYHMESGMFRVVEVVA